jgi:FkbM family methyltransferase
MNPAFQRLLLSGYALAQRSGILSTRLGRGLFSFAYDVYKARWEAKRIDQLRTLVPPGSLVIDVGANVGFFTRRFATWVGPQGRVLAIEPERVNFDRLCASTARFGTVETLQGVAADRDGTLNLVINPIHPGDHHIGAEGVPVTAFTVDRLVVARNSRPLSLIKIDVQGAELAVIEGAVATLERLRPALVVEVDPQSLNRMGLTAADLFGRLDQLGYRAHALGDAGWSDALAPKAALAVLENCDSAYLDFVFLPSA